MVTEEVKVFRKTFHFKVPDPDDEEDFERLDTLYKLIKRMQVKSSSIPDDSDEARALVAQVVSHIPEYLARQDEKEAVANYDFELGGLYPDKLVREFMEWISRKITNWLKIEKKK